MKWRWWRTTEEITQDVLASIEAKELAKKEARENEPWVDINGIVEDPKHGIKVDLDWNDAFIEYLRDNGITGVDEEIIVQKWITMLYRDLMEQGQNNDGSDRGLE